MAGKLQLNTQTTHIAGQDYGLNYWAQLVVGLSASGLFVPLLVNSDGTLAGGAGGTGAAHGTTSQVTSTGTAATLAIARPTRRGMLFRNTDAANSCWFGPSVVTSSNGFLLKPGDAVIVTSTQLWQIIDDGSNHCAVSICDEYD